MSKAATATKTTAESRLLYEVIREIGKYGAVYRTNAGAALLPNGQTFRGLPAGFADCMAILPGGKACFVEVKVKPNKPTKQQLVFIGKMQRLGCRAGVAYSVEDALKICGLPTGKEGEPPPWELLYPPCEYKK